MRRLASVVVVCFAVACKSGHANHPPRIISVPSTDGRVGVPYATSLAAADADGDALAFALVSGPAGLTVSAAGAVSWTPAAIGPQEVHVSVSDPHGATDEQVWTVQVRLNAAPVIGGIANAPLCVNEPSNTSILASDPDGDPLVFEPVGAAPAGLAVSSTSGLLSLATSTPQTGTRSLPVKVSDPWGLYATATLSLDVSGYSTDPAVNMPLASEGSNGELVLEPAADGTVWAAWRHSGGGASSIELARLAPAGGCLKLMVGIAPAFADDSVAQPALTQDGQDGVYVAWREIAAGGASSHVRVQHFAGDGSALWDAGGVRPSSSSGVDELSVAISADAQGAAVSWNEQPAYKVHGQRLALSDGARLWGPDGVSISYRSTGRNIVADGTGGAELCYVVDVLVCRRYDATGTSVNEGYLGIILGYRNTDAAIADGTGRFLFAGDGSEGSLQAFSVMRVNANGGEMWETDYEVTNSTPIYSAAPVGPVVAPDSNGNVYTAFVFNGSVQLDFLRAADGVSLWGTPIDLGAGSSPTVGVQSGSVVVTWRDAVGALQAAKYLPAGTLSWGPVALSSAQATTGEPVLVRTPSRIVIGWTDDRNDAVTHQPQPFVQAIRTSGVLGP